MLSIGKVAARAGVKVDTVRYYERRGVIPEIERRRSGYRTFRPEVVDRIVFVKELQKLGLSLADIIELLRLVDGGVASCEGARPSVEATLRRTDEKLAALRAVRDRLAAALYACDAGACNFEQVLPSIRLTRRRSASGGPI